MFFLKKLRRQAEIEEPHMVFMFIVKSAGRKLHTTIKELTFSSNMALYEKAILGVFFINFKRKNQHGSMSKILNRLGLTLFNLA